MALRSSAGRAALLRRRSAAAAGPGPGPGPRALAAGAGAGTVAVVGAGLAGLVCAGELRRRTGRRVLLLEQARGPGGRASSRVGRSPGPTPGWAWDHGCQYLGPKSAAVAGMCDAWVAQGALAEWEGTFGLLDLAAGAFAADSRPKRRLVGTPTMGALARHLAEEAQGLGVEVRFDAQVSGLRRGPGGGWTVFSESRRAGAAETAVDAVVLADCLQAPLLEGLDGADEGIAALARAMRAAGRRDPAPSNPSFAALLAVRGPSGLPDGVAVAGSERVSWMAKDSGKPGRAACTPADVELWTLQATPGFAARVLEEKGFTRRGTAEHEAVLGEVAADLAAAAREAFEAIGETFPELVAEPVAHRWGSAFPPACACEETARARCGSAAGSSLWAVGDWAAPAGEEGRVEAAVLSGLAAAARIGAG